MTSFLLRRVASTATTVWLVLTATFFVMRISPGHPAALYTSPTIPPTEQEFLIRALGLDQSLSRQYVSWLRASLGGNWGFSLNRGVPVTDLLADHLPASLLLGALSLVVAIGIGLPAGLLATWRAGSATDLLVRTVGLAIYSVPTFWLGLLAIMGLSFGLPLFPPGHLYTIGYRSAPATVRILDVLHHTALPASVLGASLAPAIARLARRSLIETLSRNFVTAARARGLSRLRVLLVHVLPQSLAPVAQIIGLSLPLLAGGVLVTEVVFSWPGMGRLTHQAMMTRDYPVVLAATALCTVAVSTGGALADVVHALLDPRVERAALSAELRTGHRPRRHRCLRFGR